MFEVVQLRKGVVEEILEGVNGTESYAGDMKSLNTERGRLKLV